MALTRRYGLSKLTSQGDAVGGRTRVLLIRINSGATGGACAISDGTDTIWAPTIGTNAELFMAFYGAGLENVVATTLPATCVVTVFTAG